MKYSHHAATVAAFLSATVCAQNATNSTTSTLPVVDLGYELHQAFAYNNTGDYYQFQNIRYAAPPVGELRFRAPQPPATNRTVVQTGANSVKCPQAIPDWILQGEAFVSAYSAGERQFNASSLPAANTTVNLNTATTVEDCLFLDVTVPKEIFDARNDGYGAPVLVWIYGGGYTEGDKQSSGNPAGLLARSQYNDASGVVFVAMNYRLGAFGWLSGPTFQQDGDANAGLLDQRAALEWIQQNIRTFGGDPNRVTVIGESAGGGSIMHQITAYGGLKGPVPFQQAVLQSPGWLPTPSAYQQEITFQAFLKLLNVTTIEQARKLPSSALLNANTNQIALSEYGSFLYGPTVDGKFVPSLPGQLLLHGQFDQSLRVMVGHNGDEGLLFTNPFLANNYDFDTFLTLALPGLQGLPTVMNYINSTLYPAVFDGSQPTNYTNEIERAAALTSELVFACNTYYLDKAYRNKTHSYYFVVPPAIHGEDIPYTFYTGNGQNQTGQQSGAVIAPNVAIAMQEWITHFALTGTPNEVEAPYFVQYGENATVRVLNTTGITEARDPAANYRCDWWQKALYY